MPNLPNPPSISLTRGLGLVILAVAIFVIADLSIGMTQHEPPTLNAQLPVALEEGDVYLIGNSIFKTGIDIEQLELMLPGESVKFSYHDGYYTNLWYLIAKNAILPSEEEPLVLVWGFRPTYAIQPAFQKRESPDITTFRSESEPFWEDVVSSRGRVPVPTDNSFMNTLGRYSTVHQGRDDFRAWLQHITNLATTSILDATKASEADTLKASLISGGDSVADVLLRTLTAGRVQMSEELIVDDGVQFITGPSVDFGQSFVPHTAELMANAGINQLVLIFKPVAETEDRLEPAAGEFADAAAAFFDAHDIPYINFFVEDSVVRDHFAKGDHYNESGRANLTEFVGRAILRLLDPDSEN